MPHLSLCALLVEIVLFSFVEVLKVLKTFEFDFKNGVPSLQMLQSRGIVFVFAAGCMRSL